MRRLTRSHLVLLIAFGLGVVLLGLLGLPKVSSLLDEASNNKVATLGINSLVSQAATQAQVDKAKVGLAAAKKVLPASSDAAAEVARLQKVGKDTGVTLSSANVSPTSTLMVSTSLGTSQVNVLKVDVVLTGSYKQVSDFLTQAGSAVPLRRVVSLNIDSNGSTSSTLNASVSVESYSMEGGK
jgi:Tfp pilus assembly protein PilO